MWLVQAHPVSCQCMCACVQVLVRKVYGDRNRRHKSRNWKLQQLNKEIEEDMSIESYDKYVLPV